MTKRYLKFFYYYLLTIFLFCTCCYIHAKLTNYFYQKTTHTIKLYSTQELKDKWLTTQSELDIQNINVESCNDIPEIMKLLGINDVSILSNDPSYNSSDDNRIIYNLKKPQDGLLDVYFKPRTNPFKITYPYDEHKKYTLDELLTHKIAIEKAYVFWDISKVQIDPNIDINIINLKYDVDTTKEAALTKYLTEIIKVNDGYAILGCYNAVPDGPIIFPFNSDRNLYYNKNKIEAVYFDDGVRIFTNCDEANNLIKLANGAKNIYLFKFECNRFKIFYYSDNKTILCTQKFNENKKLVKETFYKPDGETIIQINEYNENGQKTKVKFYQDDGKTIWAIEEYNENGQKTKVKFYQDDDKTITQIDEYNENEKLITAKFYQNDGETITQINEYNENGQKTKVKLYQDDGKNVKEIIEYNDDGTEKK
ncbi:DUF2963 domain-containing protein [Candidatus Phytoplasma sp. AldY-WA1]|uniref:DUF2963 domain-containing protein n=1 Tax=Candidatus Phytoplasma sp. AldY-WA1 TaxID=2852100 RepID=UPI00254A355B|nr:DUF2963 domain-containing protein [Candidatus Phytoplasma sp. AldY-WA1]